MFENFSSYHIKILLIILCLSIIPTFALSAVIISDQTHSNTIELKNALVSTSETSANRASDWINDQKNKLKNKILLL